MRYKTFWVFAAFVLVLIFSPQVYAIPVDLSSFETIDPTVTLGPGNSSATITEDSLDPWNAPVGLWESALDIPADALSLTFDYELVVAPYNDDYFDFYFGNLSGYSDTFGGYNNTGSALTFEGAITKDLTPYAGSILPIAFALNWDWGDGYKDYDPDTWTGEWVGNEFASVLTISNVQINPVPEPATLLLLGGGLLGIITIRKKKKSGTI